MKLRGLAVTIAVAALVVVGCTVERHWGGTSVADGGKAKIGLITKTETNPYFVALRDSARSAAETSGAEFSALAGQFDGDNDGQVKAIENFMQQGMNTILITPNSSTGVLDAINRARQSGILVLALDTATEPENAVDATYATDNVEAGRQQGSYVKAELAGATPKLLMIDGTPGSTVDTYRHDGFLKGLGVADGDPSIVGVRPANGDQNLAQQGMENLLQRTSDINAVYTMNEPTARGSFAALQARGLAGQVTMASIDGGCDGVQNVRDGQYRATVMQFPDQMTKQAVNAAVDYAKSGATPRGFHATESIVITDKPVQGVESKPTDWGLQNCWGDT